MHFEVNRQDFRQTQVADPGRPELAPGEIRMTVDRFALTSNNISYALSGDMLDYWGFFPTTDPWGRVPAMGFGTVTESANDDIEVGAHFFGFYPMADEHVVKAEATNTGFNDVGAHRANHAAVYTSFANTASDPLYREDRGDEYLLLRGLFMTSYLVDDYLDDNDFFGAGQTIVTSASSKTSIALASCLHARGHHAVGLTSAANLAFVEGLGFYDEVVTYADIESLDGSRPSVMVDMAGNADVRSRIHHHFADTLRFSSQVGATHWEETVAGGDPLPGPTPEFFFAPAQIAKRSEEWGAAELMTRIGAALSGFLEGAPKWLTVQRSAGPDAVATVYTTLLEGSGDASVGYIVAMSPEAFS